ncbi:RNA polymerase-associated protein LEO1-like [Cotesia glomerata]|nr:RNA polymerase-associated protein LEO1-like [Cotesia glomerata]
MDNEINSLAVEIAGTNVSTAYIYSPKNQSASLGISHPFIVILLKNMKRYFTMEITILDEDGMHRRFKLSNFQSKTKIRPFSTTMPMGLGCGWNQIQLNMVELVKIAYGTVYRETTRLQINANCRIRRIYFSDRLYGEEDLPEEYRISFTKPKANKEDKKDRRSITSKTSENRSLNSQTSQEKAPGDRGSVNDSQKGEENPKLEVRIPITEYDEDRSEQTNRDSVIDGEYTATELSETEAGEYSDDEEGETDNGEIEETDEEEEGVDGNEEIDGDANEREELGQAEKVGEEVGQEEENKGESGDIGDADKKEIDVEDNGENVDKIKDNLDKNELIKGIDLKGEELNMNEKLNDEGKNELSKEEIKSEFKELNDNGKIMDNLDKNESIKGIDLKSEEEFNMNEELNNDGKDESIKKKIKSELKGELNNNYEYQQTY